MSETIERVAKAISDAIDPTSGDPIGVTFHHSEFVEGETMQEQLEQVKSICLAAARAAIEAMRDGPPQNMILAGIQGYWADAPAKEVVTGTHDMSGIGMAQAYRAMIDAAFSQDTHSLPSEDR